MGFWEKIFGSKKTDQTAVSHPGSDCPFYSKGICPVGGGENPCNLGSGNYWTDCHVYSHTGLKGKYDKKKGEDARRRAHLKQCNRCKVKLEISEDVDYRYAIGEFASERDYRVTGDAAGVSCASCHSTFCTKCMRALGERHPSSGGLACLNCKGRLTKFDP